MTGDAGASAGIWWSGSLCERLPLNHSREAKLATLHLLNVLVDQLLMGMAKAERGIAGNFQQKKCPVNPGFLYVRP